MDPKLIAPNTEGESPRRLADRMGVEEPGQKRSRAGGEEPKKPLLNTEGAEPDLATQRSDDKEPRELSPGANKAKPVLMKLRAGKADPKFVEPSTDSVHIEPRLVRPEAGVEGSTCALDLVESCGPRSVGLGAGRAGPGLGVFRPNLKSQRWKCRVL